MTVQLHPTIDHHPGHGWSLLATDTGTGKPVFGRSLREAAQRLYGPRANTRILAMRGRQTLVGVVVTDRYGRHTEAVWLVS